MPKARCESKVCGQAIGVLGDHVAVGRKPRSADVGDKFAEKVSVDAVVWEDVHD